MARLLKPSRRGFLFAAASFLAAPAIVRAASLMPVKALEPAMPPDLMLPKDWVWVRITAGSIPTIRGLPYGYTYDPHWT